MNTIHNAKIVNAVCLRLEDTLVEKNAFLALTMSGINFLK
jgi:hypothetical protein